MAYQPLTEEQYNSAIKSGFTHDSILQMEQQRKASQSQSFIGKNIITPIKNAFIGGVKQTIQSSKNVANDIKTGAGPIAIADTLHAGAGIASALSSPLAPILNPTVGAATTAIADKVGDNPSVQRFANSNVGKATDTVVQSIGDANAIVGTVLGAKEGIEEAPKIVDLAEQAKAGVANTASKTLDKITPSFEQNVTKAFPTLKKDVGNMPQKITNVKTAFSDIAQNKDSLGFTDSSGNPRTPKNFAETVDAQNQRLPKIYQDYTAKLSEVDKPKFDEAIQNGIKSQVENIDNKLVNENSVDNRKALLKIKNELHTLRDTSPEGIQNYIQSINQKVKPLAPGGSLTPEQIQYANLGGDLRKVLDDSIEKIDGTGYQDLRNVYAAHKSIQSQLLMAAKKEINNVPGFTEKIGNAGLSIEGINFLLSHNPASLVTGLGVKAASKYMTWLRSPQRGLQNAFKQVDTQITPSLNNP